MSSHQSQADLQPPQSNSRRISIAELARSGSVSSHRTSIGSVSGAGAATPRFAQLSRRVTRLIGLQKSLRGSAIREDSRGGGADDFMTRMRPDEVPTNPRFSATLSVEGQYATFKCYEKLARKCLLSAEHVTPQELPHTRTPMEMVRTRFELVNPAQQSTGQRPIGRGGGGGGGGVPGGDDGDETGGGSRSQSRLSRQWDVERDIPLPGHSLTAYAPPPSSSRTQHRKVSRERRGEAPTEAAAQPRNAQLERQIRQSYRLENVMEVIDYLRSRRGQAVTNQRFQRHQIHPVEHYQMWVRLWNKDFVVRPRGPGEDGALKSYQN